jgi:ATPase family associated with various cellular activities (AAA)
MTDRQVRKAAEAQLALELHQLRLRLERHAGVASTRKAPAFPIASVPADTPLDQLCEAFDLGPFERALLILCAGAELDGEIATLCGTAHGDSAFAYPTLGLALTVLPDTDWEMLSPALPLRHWRLIEVGEGPLITRAPLKIDEAVLHFLMNGYFWDEQLAGLISPLEAQAAPVPSHQRLADQLATLWENSPAGEPLPVLQLVGTETEDRRAIIAAAAEKIGQTPFAIALHTLPTAPRECERLQRRWERMARLLTGLLVIEEDMAGADDANQAAQWVSARALIDEVDGAAIVSARQRRQLGRRTAVTLDVPLPTAAEQSALWRDVLGHADPALVAKLASHFDLGAASIASAAAAARGVPPETAGALVWDTCRAQVRPRLDHLAQRVESAAGWDDLVLPERPLEMLREISAQVRLRGVVQDEWGFARRGPRGRGVVALFAGSSGTGKTLAAEILANELALDLYRIDLSAVVDKYIGETEKNLARIFEAADNGTTILFFDEADTLFGKRSEVKDSRDRYANIEVGYLLQRLETYRGLAILASNMREAVDTAFLRRIRFVVDFPYPDETQRALLWRRAFPAKAPLDGVDFAALARLHLSGGQIATVAVNAAFLAADAGQPIGMPHVVAACRQEMAKAGLMPTDPLLRRVQ